MARADVAESCVQALRDDAAPSKTFELYSAPGRPPTDWHPLFAALQADAGGAS